jgi:hypothetical protein
MIEERHGRDRPLPAFAGLLATYSGVVAGLTALAVGRGAMPGRISASDLALYSVATHKLSRLIAQDAVTSPIRAPFTEVRSEEGVDEPQEHVVGDGWHRAVGELVTCPFCLGQWIGTAFVFGGMLIPRLTRAVAATFVVHAASDVLQYGYAALERTDR